MTQKKSTEFGCWSLSDIIEGRYFRVPDYQRGYAWGQRQLEEFWDDLCVVLKSGGKHYTGAITVKAMPPGAPEIPSREGFEVVDGQQRLTTMAILLSVFNQDGNPFVLRNEEFVFGYGQNNADKPFFRSLLLGNELNSPENSHQRNLKNAVEFFKAKVTDVDVSAVVDIVMEDLMFDFRIIGSEYSEGLVFETMNNRGKPLTLLEKLKNQ